MRTLLIRAVFVVTTFAGCVEQASWHYECETTHRCFNLTADRQAVLESDEVSTEHVDAIDGEAREAELHDACRAWGAEVVDAGACGETICQVRCEPTAGP